MLERVEIHYHVYIQVFDGSFERKARGRLLHLAKRYGPKRAFFSCKWGYKTYISCNMICMFCTIKYLVRCLLMGHSAMLGVLECSACKGECLCLYHLPSQCG